MNAVIYARYSSHSQTEQSIEGQLRDNYAWAKEQGITVIGEYIDRAMTGTKDQRPDFLRMINDARNKQFELVIVWKLDRFARNRYDSAVYKAKLKKYGVKVVSVKENITDSPEGIILEGLLESMAEYYSANLAQNIRRGQRESIKKGRIPGGALPYGYNLKDGKLIINEKQAPAVRYAFEQYASGTSKKDIVDELNRRGFRNRKNGPMTHSSVYRMLRNTAYIGKYVYGETVIEGASDPLVSDELFREVQDRLKATATRPGAGKAKINYLLRGKCFCGHCGASMIGECGRGKQGINYYYYSCLSKKKHHACKKKNERKDFLEDFVVRQTIKYIIAPDHAAHIAKAVVEEYDKEFSNQQIGDLEKQLSQIDREAEKLVDAFVDAPKIARQKINERLEALEARKEDVEIELAKLRSAQSIRLTEKEVVSSIASFYSGDPSDPEFCQRIIDVFVNSVFVYDDRIVIFYNIRGGKQVSLKNLMEISDDAQKSSDLNSIAPLIETKSELEPYYVFVGGMFGCIFQRHQTE